MFGFLERTAYRTPHARRFPTERVPLEFPDLPLPWSVVVRASKERPVSRTLSMPFPTIRTIDRTPGRGLAG
jgi:hypothetical protein